MLDLPLEYALIGFENAKRSGKIVPELLNLADRGIVRFVDIAFIQKDEDGTTRTLDQVIVQLRRKLGDNGVKPRHLLTVHGVGYKLVL